MGLRKGLTSFIYNGWYYPVVGSSIMCNTHQTATIKEWRFGGFKNFEKWWSFPFGIKCKFKNFEKPYKDKCITKILNHPEMNIVKIYCSNVDGTTFSEEPTHDDWFKIYVVETLKGKYIGTIKDAYFLTNLTEFAPAKRGGYTISSGWNEEEKRAYGWSHRAICSFGIGDMIFEEKFGNSETLFSQHGSKPITNKKEAIKAAKNFAKSVS